MTSALAGRAKPMWLSLSCMKLKSSASAAAFSWPNTREVRVPPLEGGVSLVGGRLDYVDNRVVAAVVYKRRKHTINVLIWPGPTNAEGEPRSLTRQTYHLVHFTHGGMTTWAVSDLNPEELRAFVELLRGHEKP